MINNNVFLTFYKYQNMANYIYPFFTVSSGLYLLINIPLIDDN